MKLNFWQWIGLVIFVICLAYLIYRESRPAPTPAVPVQVVTPAT